MVCVCYSIILPPDLVSLILLAGSPDTSGPAVTEALKFLSHLVSLSQKRSDAPHLDGILKQVDAFAHVEQSKVILYVHLIVGTEKSCIIIVY